MEFGIRYSVIPVRQAEGRQPSPSAATEQGGPRGYDGGKKVNGRKRHINTIGLLLAVVVHAASIQDRDGALVFRKLKGKFPRLKLIWADGGYTGQLVDWVLDFGKWILEIVNRPKGIRRPRWVVERTFAWLGRYRRLSKDYERTDTSECLIEIAMINLMLNRLSAKIF